MSFRSALIFIFTLLFVWQAQAGRIDLPQRLDDQLNQILKASEGLQSAMVKRSEDHLDLSIRETVSEIERTISLSGIAKPYEQSHLLRILRSAKEYFELAQGSYGRERDQHLIDGLNQLVNIVRIYRVDPSYGIFFCARDKNSWVQKGKKAQDPFRTPASTLDCGIRVSN